ncbi:DODA-type extradiol aromatic ring-opening family dioxygenase [Granulosicoccus antarcticus]|uniref:4,5-DOPA dioxygenase extradiol n=1 Tax=Granulosicoccus antarcticus IMCC3135 TaxID=1192854 RepID=A0A2Z2NHX3_9GAMM|nr:class III extradiol ring-cleavage dioxygenase [Granulosicoccus antarcticus]ASJ70902.1 4,5-DOPA dioxygenase extradiol [Granulosicoccus antarcticus IMCC3135]
MLPTYFISHGGGPWPWMESQRATYARLSSALQKIPQQLGSIPRAILMVSAHWEATEFTVTSKPMPGMIYDYNGFPKHTYAIRYPAPGNPELAQQVQTLLSDNGFASQQDAERGFDHGMYAPMALIDPLAATPVVQLSLKHGLDPLEHLAMGRALAPLRQQGILIIGSGLSYHNLQNFGPDARQVSAEFDDWVQKSMALPDSTERAAALVKWENAPSARQAHPREEHLLPLMVAVGAAGEDPSQRVYHESDFMGGISVSNFRFSKSPLAE